MKKIALLTTLLSASISVFAALPSMNASTLKQYDGKEGHKSYVALNGYVYDVSGVDEWKGGQHYKNMVAGTDLTPYIGKSPHGAEIVNDEGLKPIATYSNK